MKLFLAWCECKDFMNIAMNNWTNNLLFSNYHRSDIDVELLKKNNKEVIMDSWLFTMMFWAGKWKKYTEEDLMNYTKKYISDMKQIWRYWTIVEMDVHKILWIEKLSRFRDYFEQNRPLEKVMFVYHIEEWVEWLKKIAKIYPYIALSIPEFRIVYWNRTDKAISYFLHIINSINSKCKVHLLWCTSVDLLKRKGYYSCDSSSWLSSWRYWELSIFMDWKLKNIWNKKGFNINMLMEKFWIKNYWKDYLNNTAVCAKQYQLIEQYINKFYFNN